MIERHNLERIGHPMGSQAQFHEQPTIDALTSMVIALLGEVSVLRDRLDANERLSHGPAAVDGYNPDAAAVQARQTVRNAMYDRVLGVALDRLLPAQLAAQQTAYTEVLGEVAKAG
jgi:hypothetical protein